MALVTTWTLYLLACYFSFSEAAAKSRNMALPKPRNGTYGNETFRTGNFFKIQAERRNRKKISCGFENLKTLILVL